jgi:Domain of Unknown Function with PDB structure (DUF3857)
MNGAITGTACALLLLAAAPAANAQLTLRRADIDIEVRDDGTSVQTTHIAIETPNQSIAERIAEQPIIYSSSRQELTVSEAYTQKLDGSRLPVSPDTVRTEPVPGSSNFPLFNDLSRKVVIFPSVAAYDVIAYTARLETRRP